MIYFNFKNYEEFKELFGVCEHGNGNKSRRNKILLSLYKSKELLNYFASEHVRIEKRLLSKDVIVKGTYVNACYVRYQSAERGASSQLFLTKDMTTLFHRVAFLLTEKSIFHDYRIELNGLCFFSDKYRLDDFKGICEDGDTRSIRYYNIERERVFKMKAGKFMRNIIEENPRLNELLPEQVKIWFCEEFAEQWKAYAATQINTGYTLHVDDKFNKIYDSDYLKGNFGSCMVNQYNWSFYRDSVDAKAAYLTNADDEIVARCVIYTDVKTEDGRTLRLAERQYSTNGDETLKRQLVMALINAGEIDGYKKVGADCHSARAFVDVNGNAFADVHFSIRCSASYGDTISYQDSFKWLDISNGVAYNYGDCDYDVELDTTDGTIEDEDNHDDEVYSNYYETWYDREVAVYVEHRSDWFHEDDVCYTENTDEHEFIEDCIQIGGNYYYAGRNCEEPEEWGLVRCGKCDDWCLSEDSYYSDVTGEYYCCEDCMEEAEADYKERYWHYSEYDEEYYEFKSEITTAMLWVDGVRSYVRTTINVDTLADIYQNGEATCIDGVYYIDELGFDGEPIHICAAELCVA